MIADMGISSYKDMNELLKNVDFTDKDVYIMPYGGSVMPQLESIYNRICCEAEDNEVNK